MGIEIMKSAVVYGSRLSGNAYKVLVAMALSALDKPSNGRPASLYWGGWDALALALGHENADRNTAGHNAVARAVRELKLGRHITPMVEAGRGTRQSYMVHPGGLGAGRKGEQNAHSTGEQNAHTKGEQNGPQRVSKTVPPRTHKDSSRQNEDISITSATEPQTAREPRSDEGIGPHKFEGSPGADCLTCDQSYLDRKLHPLYLLRGLA